VRQVVVGYDAYVGPWVCAKTGGTWVAGRGASIGLLDTATGLLLAGALFEDFNGANVLAHVAAVPGKSWLNREFLWFSFHYAFEQLGCKRITGVVAASNQESRRFNEHLGYTLEATLKDAHPTGDLLVYCMRKEDCRWLNIKRSPHHGQKRCASGA